MSFQTSFAFWRRNSHIIAELPLLVLPSIYPQKESRQDLPSLISAYVIKKLIVLTRRNLSTGEGSGAALLHPHLTGTELVARWLCISGVHLAWLEVLS
jgi:hypothetical protein